MKVKKSMLITVIVGIVLLSFCLMTYKIRNTILNKVKKEEEEKFSYYIYNTEEKEDHMLENILVTVKSDTGIEYIEYPDEFRIQGNNKTQIAFDYSIKKDETKKFKIKEIDKAEIEKEIHIDDQEINDLYISIDTLKDEIGYKVFEVTNQKAEEYPKTYYRVGKNGEWIEKDGKISVLDYSAMAQELSNGDGTVTVYAKIQETQLSHHIIMEKTYNVDTKKENNTYVADSLIQAIEKYNYGSGVATVTVKDVTYKLRVYQLEGNREIIVDTPVGIEGDTATASTYAQSMTVLKVKGDLDIAKDATLTSIANSVGYGGTKGLMVYCTGTLTNNGEITMTARGAKAVGENVYLWKNARYSSEDTKYEYVPAYGGAGGEEVRCEMSGKVGSPPQSKEGNKGNDGIGRETGGGASGASSATQSGSVRISGSGNYGTSYSGGTGGGSVWTAFGINKDRTATSGAEDGGIGGNFSYDYFADGAGGAGNPGGNDSTPCGTGGLLIIYANSMENNNKISSNGVSGQEAYCGGGSSGGGTINIFFRDAFEMNGIIEANGGQAVGSSYKGGAGGNGTVSIGSIATGTYDIYDDVAISNESLIRKIQRLTVPGEQMITVRYDAEDGEKEYLYYNINLIIYDGDLVLDGKKVVEGATLNGNVYEFGDKTNDVATESTNAKNMVVLKVNGNLTINEGVTLTTCKSDDGYGGPKGLTVYCKGTLTNNGEITMTARGAKAEGENIYLWKNARYEREESKYEYVPAVGGAGGAGFRVDRAPLGESYLRNGNKGENGTKRQTGGRRDRFN